MAVDPSCYRLQSKRPRKITRDWFEKCLGKAFTDTEFVAKLRELTSKELVEVVVKYLPKEVKQENHSLIRLVINGLPQGTITREIGQTTEVKAIQDGSDEDE